MGYQVATSGAAERQGIVHRLDVGTTGVDGGGQERARVLACSSVPSSRARSTSGTPLSPKVIPIRRAAPSTPRSGGTHPRTTSSRSSRGGRPSITHYATEEAFRAATLLDIHLETGRTHQIRVHLAAIRHPCVGDLTYGADPVLAARLGLSRQWLHARELGFPHPVPGAWTVVRAPYPPDLQHALDLLRADS